jgi:hypothetical protein
VRLKRVVDDLDTTLLDLLTQLSEETIVDDRRLEVRRILREGAREFFWDNVKDDLPRAMEGIIPLHMAEFAEEQMVAMFQACVMRGLITQEMADMVVGVDGGNRD